MVTCRGSDLSNTYHALFGCGRCNIAGPAVRQEESKDEDVPPGVPEFWLNVLRNYEEIGETVHAPALPFLQQSLRTMRGLHHSCAMLMRGTYGHCWVCC